MLFGQRSQKCQESIEILIGQPAELLGDEFALAHNLSISFYGSRGAPANNSNFPKHPAANEPVFSSLRLSVNRSLSGRD